MLQLITPCTEMKRRRKIAVLGKQTDREKSSSSKDLKTIDFYGIWSLTSVGKDCTPMPPPLHRQKRTNLKLPMVTGSKTKIKYKKPLEWP